MIIGLTGFSGTGKSTVAALFESHGFHHIDCDQLVHQEVYRDPKVLRAIAAVFGNDTVKNGHLDRVSLRNKVMHNDNAIHQLNQVVMPAVIDAIDAHLVCHQNQNIILDAPLLFEYELEKKCNYSLSVISDEQIAIARIMERDGLPEQDAKNRLARQHSAIYYAGKSDFVIYNNQDFDALKQQVEAIIKKII